ncbi:hypothetical protein DAPPUDRAFT_322611 [Daphnia pulex]|uniref:Uncharacterized protein n=1 Tax=Daphnia pulex TaxID=6669 RepID=E9GWI9_DAPPU|nr:hypothetical protein DAPPUDRAFT_322611 [Daphnia pulex]|eukprot:EFX76109.1 hypothetical protein DAPPUDRAFT_322611 [Daphnia pulex]
MYTQMFYIVLALLFAISQLGIPKVLFLIGCLRWGEFWTEIISSYSLLRSLIPELHKYQPQEAILTIDSLPDDDLTAKDNKLVATEPVLEPKDTIPAEVSPFKEQLETEEKKSVQFDTKVEKPKKIQLELEQQLETGQNNPELKNNQTQEAILTIDSLSFDDNPEPPVSEPVDIPTDIPVDCNTDCNTEVIIPPSNEPLEMLDEREPESLSILPEIIVDSTGNVTNKDPVLGETQLDEIAKETIIPEESERVEEDPLADAQSKITDDKQSKDDEMRRVNRESRPPTERDIIDEVSALSKLMVPDEEMIVPEESERVEEQPAADEAQSKSTADGHQLTDEDSVNRQSPLLTEEEIDDEPTGLSKLMTPDEQMEKNQDEEKESSLFGLKKSTVGFVKMAVSDLMHDENGHVSALKMQLNDESNNPVGEAYLELDMKVGDLPEVVPSPAELKRQERKLKARQILSDTITQSIHHTGNDKKPQTDKTSNIIKNVLKNIFLEEKTTNCLHNPPFDEFIVRGQRCL